jgi:transcriptional regulator with XRE-family HTH domain
MEELVWHVGDVVRKVREQHRLNQKRLADRSHLNKATIVAVEQNAPGIRRETYEAIARAFALSLGELFSMVPVPPSRSERAGPSSTDAPVTSIPSDTDKVVAFEAAQPRYRAVTEDLKKQRIQKAAEGKGPKRIKGEKNH